MGDMFTYLAGALAFFVAVGIFSRWLEHRHEASRRDGAYIRDAPFVALGSPSRTNAVDRRIEVAIRDAARGFQTCEQCLFTNRVRAESCVVCGVRFAKDDEKPAAPQHSEHSSPVLTRRQLRVRKRKEWTRQVDDQEQIIWQHNPDSQGQQRVSYLLMLSLPASSIGDSTTMTPIGVEEPSTPRADRQTDAATNALLDSTEEDGLETIEVVVEPKVEAAPAPVLTLAQAALAIREEVATLLVSVTEASQGLTVNQRGSLDHPLIPTVSAHDLKDAITNAQCDFPTKLAQFITATSAVFLQAAMKDDGTIRSTRFSILRESLVADSVAAIATMSPAEARAAIRVDFVGEQGIDAGGVYREWFLLLNDAIMLPSAGVFECVDVQDHAFYLNPHSFEILGDSHLAHVLAAGRLLGRALLDGNATGFHLAIPLLKIVLGLPVGLSDVEYFDPDVYKNLTWLLENSGAEHLGLDFSVLEKLPDGTHKLIELVPGGCQIDVTDTNKHHYVERKVQYLLFERVQSQLFAFLKGIYEVVPAEILMLFDAEELDFVLSGSDEIDVDDWEHNSQTSGNLLQHPALRNFWKVLRELSLDERRRLLQFATGSTRVPPGGFAALTSFDGRQCMFTLHGLAVWRTQGYIRSHACFNRLDLPMHADLKTMRMAIQAAIAVDSFGFTSN